MESINKLLLYIVLVSVSFTLRTENLDTQIDLACMQNPNVVPADQARQTPNALTSGTDKEQINPQEVLNAVEAVVNIVGAANDYINTIIPADDTVANDQQTVSILSATEIEKWKYVNNYFVTSIDCLSYSEKIGKFINEYAAFLSMPTVVLYTLLTDSALTNLKSIFTGTTDEKVIKPIDAGPKADTSITSKAINGTINLGTGSLKYITAPIIGGLITYKILKFISTKIENKTEKCNAALITFAKDWDKHKEQTPEILWSLFEHLNKEVVDNNGKLPKIDAVLAQKIIEAVITSSSIYNSINS
jgi:hypothetical protein